MLRLIAVLLVLSNCASKPPNLEPHHQMRSLLFMPEELRSDSKIKKIVSADVPENHAVDWTVASADDFHPLTGIKIALDPGHVGGAPWDERNGKYVFDSDQNRLSEGKMALQLAEELARDLREAGAVVRIDRPELKPVTNYDYNDFAMFPAVYFQRLDLDARAERILEFNPDITLILHFDSHMPGDDLNLDHAKELCNDTKAYISGAFEESDFNSDEDRAFFHLVWSSPRAWQDSLDLSREIVGQIHNSLGIPFDNQPHEHMRMVEPGVFARNLRLQRRLAGRVSSYIESLCYEDHGEFAKLLKDQTRIAQLARAIAQGVKSFVHGRATIQVAYP